MGNPAPCGRRSRSHIHSMLLCLLLAKPGIAAYCCAKNKTIKPRQRSGATVRFLCKAFFLAKESGEGRDTAFPSPQTPLPQEPSRDCCGSLGSSIKLLRLRSRGECLWHSFRSLAAYCSSSAHPRNICCVGFARMEMLAKYIRMRTARSAATASHPLLNMPQRASTNIGNRAKQKNCCQNPETFFAAVLFLYLIFRSRSETERSSKAECEDPAFCAGG